MKSERQQVADKRPGEDVGEEEADRMGFSDGVSATVAGTRARASIQPVT